MAGVKGKSGGFREGAGRKPAAPRKRRSSAFDTDDPDDFLRAVMRDPNSDFKDRMAAALALKKTGKGGAPLGKKEQQQQAAEGVARRSLAPTAPPSSPRVSLRVVGK